MLSFASFCSLHLPPSLFFFHVSPFFLAFLSPLISILSLSSSLFSLSSLHFCLHHFPSLRPSLCLFLSISHTPFFSVCWQSCALLTTASCWVTTPHTRTHTLPRGVSACYSDNAADKTNNRQIYKNGLKFHLILGDFHISAALINPVFRHACRFRKTRGARKINRLNYNRKFWSHSSPNSTGTFVTGLKIDIETTASLKSLKMSSSVLTQAVVFHLGFIFLLFALLFPRFFDIST